MIVSMQRQPYIVFMIAGQPDVILLRGAASW